MKKKRRGWIWLIVLVVCGVAAAILLPLLLPAGDINANTQQYRAEKVTMGDIRVTVHGTGSIEPLETVTVSSESGGTVDAVLLENGDTVQKGQIIATLNADTVKSRIESLKEQIAAQDMAISRLRAAPVSQIVYAPVECRVKAIYAKVNDDVSVSMGKNGALMVLSTDGRMKVEFTPEPDATVTPGSKVKLEIDGKTVNGFITEAPDGAVETAVAVITSDSYAVGKDAVVKNADGALIGRGKLEINRPLLITASTGKVNHFYVKAGDIVKSGRKLVKLTGAILDANFEAQLVTRQQLQSDLDEAYADLEDMAITAPEDGIVTELAVHENGAIQQGMAVCTIHRNTGYKLVVAVDELDVPRIGIGQKAEVKIDALPEEIAVGEVIRISPVGVKVNDVTTYEVTVQVDAPKGTLVMMNASADIEVAFKSGTLLVPVEAVRTVNGKSWVYGALPDDIRNDGTDTGAAQAGGSFPGARMFARLAGGAGGTGNAGTQRPNIEVAVGLVSDTTAEILSGLNEGDEVAVPVAQGSIGSMFGFGSGRSQDGGGGSPYTGD